MELKYCWRCDREVHMLNDQEFKLCHEALAKGRPIVEAELAKRNISDYTWLEKIETFEKFRYFVEMHKLITGYYEANPNAIFHHNISQYGKDCPSCGKPLRTPIAKYCPKCGHGKENFSIPGQSFSL